MNDDDAFDIEGEHIRSWSISKLKREVMRDYPDSFGHAGKVFVFFDGTKLDPGARVPESTSSANPLILTKDKSKKPKLCLPPNLMVGIDGINRPPPVDLPKFVAGANLLIDTRHKIERELATSDSAPGNLRSEPVALVRCNRGGKSRALLERCKQGVYFEGGGSVPIIFVTFNDYAVANAEDKSYPLQVLLYRIAFAALRTRNEEIAVGGSNLRKLYQDFRDSNYAVTQKDVTEWIGTSPVLLVIELNSLDELQVDGSTKASSLNLLRIFFLSSSRGRHLVFTTHVQSTLNHLGVFLNPFASGERNIQAIELPLVESLQDAKALNGNLKGPREAIYYYGLMPGLIYDRTHRIQASVTPKRKKTLQQCFNDIASGNERSETFYKVLLSLIDGDLTKVGCGNNRITELPKFQSGTDFGTGSFSILLLKL